MSDQAISATTGTGTGSEPDTRIVGNVVIFGRPEGEHDPEPEHEHEHEPEINLNITPPGTGQETPAPNVITKSCPQGPAEIPPVPMLSLSPEASTAAVPSTMPELVAMPPPTSECPPMAEAKEETIQQPHLPLPMEEAQPMDAKRNPQETSDPAAASINPITVLPSAIPTAVPPATLPSLPIAGNNFLSTAQPTPSLRFVGSQGSQQCPGSAVRRPGGDMKFTRGQLLELLFGKSKRAIAPEDTVEYMGDIGSAQMFKIQVEVDRIREKEMKIHTLPLDLSLTFEEYKKFLRWRNLPRPPPAHKALSAAAPSLVSDLSKKVFGTGTGTGIQRTHAFVTSPLSIDKSLSLGLHN